MKPNVRSNRRVDRDELIKAPGTHMYCWGFDLRLQWRLFWGCYSRPYLSSGIQTETFIAYHLSEYLREASQRIEHEAGCRHTYALPSELQNWIIHQKPTRRRIGDGIAAPRGSSCAGGGGLDIYIYMYTYMYMIPAQWPTRFPSGPASWISGWRFSLGFRYI